MLKRVLRNPMFYVRRQMVEREMLFDLVEDPDETRNLASQQPQRVDAMRRAVDTWLAECNAYATLSDTTSQVGLDEETIRQLEGLGYL